MRIFRLLLLGVLAALAAREAAAAAPFRLFEVSVTRFTRTDSGAQLEVGLINARGELRVIETHQVAVPPGMPEAAWGRPVLTTEWWHAYQSLGSHALANFERGNNTLPVVIANIPHYIVEARENAELNVGRVVNLSTRGTVAAGDTPTLIGGFVIEGEWRRVLIRAVGPSLAPFGVNDAASDPFLTVRQGTLALYFNGNWGMRPDAGEIAAVSAAAGAFPLPSDSKDAALLLELPPGQYTASVTSEATPASGGTALLEIYILP